MRSPCHRKRPASPRPSGAPPLPAPEPLGRRALLLILLVLSGCATSPPAAPQPPPRPNVILILADDLGYGELGVYGQRKIRTPRLDAVATEGLRFTQWYASAPVCAPTRCSLLTGLHSGHMQVRDNKELPGEGQEPLLPGTLTLARVLGQAGYVTGLVGKWGLGGPGSTGEPRLQGFDHSFGYLCQRQAHNYYPTHLWRNGAKVALEGNTAGNVAGRHYVQDLFLEEIDGFVRAHRDQPFFLYAAFTLPHMAMQPEEEDVAPYRGLWADPPYGGQEGYLPHPSPHAGYAAMVSRLDRDVGRIVDLLRELGLDERTVILFTSDNGPTHGRVGGADSAFFDSTAGLRGLKGSLYEGGLRVPMIARWPGRIPGGRTSPHLGAHQDLLPTILDLAGIGTPPGRDGISAAPTLLGGDGQGEHPWLYWEFPGYGGQQAVRLGRWKAVRPKMRSGNLDIELYDLETDERESRDVAAENPEVVAQVTRILREDRTPSVAFPLPGVDAPAPAGRR